MPEHPEIRYFARMVNSTFADTEFVELKCENKHKKQEYVRFDGKYHLHALQRGKQLKLIIDGVQSAQTEATESYNGKYGVSAYFGSYDAHSAKHEQYSISLILGLGLTGYLAVESLACKDYILSFRTTSCALNLRSKTPESVYFYIGDFDAGRGPDPVFEFEAFERSVLYTNFGGRRICEILMDYRYFNGVGNYLRSEIIHRRHVPHSTKIAFFEADFPAFVTEIIQQAFAVVQAPQKFVEWLQCYGKAPNSVKDKNGRTIWFFKPTGSPAKAQVLQSAYDDEKEATRFTQSLMIQ